MTTLTITIDERTKKGKSFLQFLETLKDDSYLTIDTTPYNQQAVKDILEGNEQIRLGKGTKIKTDDLWK